MKILCLTPWFPEHAQAQQGNYILDSLYAIKALGYQQRICVIQTWKPSFKSRQYFTVGLNVEFFSYLSVPRHYLRVVSNWLFLRHVTAILENEISHDRPDIIHVHTEFYAIPAVKVAKKYNIPVVVTIHGIETSPRYWRSTKKLISQALNQVASVILVGEPLRQLFKVIVGRDNHFCVVHNGFRFSKVLDECKIEPWSKKIKIISVSNLHKGKGVDITLQALAQLYLAGLKDWHYTIVGGGPEQQKLISLVESLALNDWVTFAGPCSHDKVYEYLMLSDVFVLPSYCEAFGIAYIEAMAAGLLTIGVVDQGPSEFIVHSKTGLLVQPNSVDSVENTLKTVFKGRESMQIIAKTGKKYVRSHFSWGCHAAKIAVLYQEIKLKKK